MGGECTDNGAISLYQCGTPHFDFHSPMICPAGALDIALKECSRSICKAALRETLNYEEIALIKQFAEAMESSRNPEGRLCFKRSILHRQPRSYVRV